MQIKLLFHCAKISAASVLIVGLSFAQSSLTTTPRKSARGAASGMASGRRQYSPTVQTIDSVNSTQRKDGAIHSADFPRSSNARNGAHATESMNQTAGAAKGENPLYEDHGKSGTNPLYESKDRAASPANTPADTSRKHVAGVKYQNRTGGGQQSSISSSNTETFKQDFGQVQATKR